MPKASLSAKEPTAQATVRRSIEEARHTGIFRHYEQVRDTVLRMMDDASEYGPSAYWKEELAGFDYMFDAGPLLIAKLREHTYHLTGLKPYEYREHHADQASRFASKLRRLQEVDSSNLFVPEAPQLGGFGHRIGGRLVNLDTLRFYECLIALDRAGVVSQMRGQGRHCILEIGAGWGGFAYQLKTLFPNTTYIIVDLPPTLLFSATYVKATFPGARMKFCGERPEEQLFDELDRTDFIFLPAHAFARARIPPVDVAVNLASFQEMTTEQVTGYVQKLADSGCRQLYSLNRDRSRHNQELSTVTEIMETRYRVERLEVLDVPYTNLVRKPGKAEVLSATDYRHQIGRC
jgi:putative sugar O-methyltransferase